MVHPLWITQSKAIRRFNYGYSLPRVWFSSLALLTGQRKIGNPERPLVVVNSISGDYARVWLHFVQQVLEKKHWDIVVVDSAGDMDVSKFEGCQVIRFLNIYHGQKMDLLLRRVIRANLIFQCDDDQYILHDLAAYMRYFDDANTAAVSLYPRSWWYFTIHGNTYWPMGSYALFYRRDILLKHRLKFQAPRNRTSDYKVFQPGVKVQYAYDTCDYANEQLLLLGYTIVTLLDAGAVLGFSGLSAPRILLMTYGKDYVKRALCEAKHYQEGSINGAVMKALYGIVKFERLYQHVFRTRPRFVSGFDETELREIVAQNARMERSQKTSILTYFDTVEDVSANLLSGLGR